MSKSLRRFSGLLSNGVAIELLTIPERREYFKRLNERQLMNACMQMSEAINRLWEIYRVKEGVE